MWPKSNVVFYRSDHHSQTELLLKMEFFIYMEKKATPCNIYFICKDISKIVGMFSKTFPWNIYSVYLVCVHPIVIKKKKLCEELKSKSQVSMCSFTVINSLVIQVSGQTEWRIKCMEVAACAGADSEGHRRGSVWEHWVVRGTSTKLN